MADNPADRTESAAKAADPASGADSEAGATSATGADQGTDPAVGSASAGGAASAGGEDLPSPRPGPELARAVLDAAAAKRRSAAPKRRRAIPSRGGPTEPDGTGRRRRSQWSGPGADPRDPQPFGSVLAKLMKARGWQRPAAEATLFGQWEKVVGPDIAEHCRPVKLEQGELTLEAESTAWATQLRLLAGSLLKQIAGEVGHNVVKRLRIHGPAAPSWSRGPRRVRGRGPRDTYG